MIVLTGMQSICCGVEDLNRVDFSKGKYDPTTYNDLYEDKTATIVLPPIKRTRVKRDLCMVS